MEAFYMIVGIAAIYSEVHFFILQKKSYGERTSYEKVVSIVAMVFICLAFLALVD